MKRKQGFTLVELLVVIGIIALLISILLPALNTARASAQIIKCAAQMRGIVQAVTIYAQDNKGALPPIHLDDGKPTFDLKDSPTTVAYLWSLSWGGGSSFNVKTGFTPVTDPGANLGRLMALKYLPRTEQSFSCPSKKDQSDYHSTYHFNPHLKTVSSGGTSVTQHWWKKLPNYGKVSGVASTSSAIYDFRHAILTDPMYDILNSPHTRAAKKVYNFAYTDGSVLSYTAPTFAIRNGNLLDKWGRLIDFSNALQYGADGKPITWTDYASWNNKFNVYPVNPN